MQTFDQHRYKSPKMRARRERMEGEENPMEHGMDEKPMEQASGFASADVFGRAPKEGDTFTIMITSVDPDTGEAEFKVDNKPMAESEPEPMAEPAMPPTAAPEMA
jgi:hypothetical protein